LAQAALTTAYNAIQNGACTPLTLANTGTTVGRNLSTLSGVTLAPGTYCIDDVAKTGTLTLTGPRNGIWIFKIGSGGTGALTGTNFSVVMAGGGQACNVTWWVAEAATMTTSLFKGTILAGAAITIETGGVFAGRALARAAVTMTGASVIGCGARGALSICNGGGRDDDDDDDDEKDQRRTPHPFGR